MNKRVFRTLSWMMALVLIAGLLLIPAPASAAPAAPTANIQDGVTLHCWNWSFKNIEEKMETIASLGYASIQTSPIQLAKQPTAGFPTNDWWVYYQPADFVIDDSGNSALGTKAEFESMCAAAHKYGIKVIVDVVANHMANTETGTNGIGPSVNPDLKDDRTCWHDVYKNINNYNDRKEVIEKCMAALPDLNTANPKVQTAVLNFLKECIDAGADGFRFDAAKHIETPDDGDMASNFWPTVINGATDYAKSSRNIDLYCYGELLDNPGGNISVKSYTKFMRVTDNAWSAGLLSGNLAANYYKGEADDVVIWAESHDTYADGSTKDVSEASINKAWALIAARADAMGLYLARPANMSQWLGAASDTAWAYPEVAAVNHFRNAFVGQSEYVAKENGVLYVERGTAGVVLVNSKGGAADISVTANKIADGSYTDLITGNAFTVSGGKISGKIGDTGIAVVMEGNACAHTAHNTDGFCTECKALVGHDYDASGKCACGDSQVSNRVIYFNNTEAWGTVNFYSWYDEINIISGEWPGNPMTKVEGNIYSCELPSDAPNIIFNNSKDQTADLKVPADKNMYDFATGEWSVYGEEEKPQEPEKPTEPADPTEPTDPTEPSQDVQNGEDNASDEPAVHPALLVVTIIAAIVAVGMIILLIIKKKGGK